MSKITFFVIAVALLLVPAQLKAAPAPPNIEKTIAFIFLADENGNLRVNPATQEPLGYGTAFLVSIPNERGTGEFEYLVTAKHVLENENEEFFRRVFVRLNNRDKSAELLVLDVVPSGPNQNVFTHNDPSVDIAVIPVVPDQDKIDFLTIPISMIKSKEDFKKTTITAGSDVFFVGLFMGHYGDKVNTPIFRFGRVAMITDDRIRWQEGGKPVQLAELYLLETMSFGGNSGAPVFFSLGIDREPGKLYVGTEITLAGVMRGNFNEPRVGTFIPVPNAVLPAFAQNIGIAAVTPAYLLHDILYSEKLKKLREAALNKSQ